MKKVILGLTCVLSAATCILCACNKAPDIGNVKWSNAGISAETLTLPELELAKAESYSGRNGTGITVVWNDATEENYDALASECYTKIPANRTLFDEEAELADLKTVQSSYCVFMATYKVSDDQYTCTVMYFKTDVDDVDGSYKEKQLLLSVEKANIEHMSHEYWDIDSNDKTWYTADELALLGLDGLAAPQGDILAKKVELQYKNEELDYGELQFAVENSTKSAYDTYVKNIFDEYIKGLGENGEFDDKEYNDRMLYFTNEDTRTVMFTPRYKVNGKTIDLNVVYKDAHIVVQAIIWNF
ncbi:MAG: hypothetical protein K2N22_02915 [Clostridia bacterium]|nr:hypothetical protein [Clostridia bacterium]